MRFSVVNIGCKVNRVEVDAAAAELIRRGATLSHDADSDIVIVNTCTVTGEADKKTRKAVRQALREHPRADVLVTGCAAVMNPDWFEQLDARVHVVQKPQVAQRAADLGGIVSPGGNATAETPFTPALRKGEGFRTRVGVKVQDGCDNACTYCIVHVARGRSRSMPFEDIVAQARAHAESGVREIVLTGINLGAYNDDGRLLPDLLETLLACCPMTRFRIGSVEPNDVSERLVDIMASSDGRVCRHLHLPLQSGSSRVLAEMDRPYDAEAFIALVNGLRAAMPGISLSTDVIVGFPGETDGDFEKTMELSRIAAFSRIHVFRYSRREGTPAAARSDQVDSNVAATRAQVLSGLALQLRIDDARKRTGSHELVLVERPGHATTESYHTVRFDARSAAAQSLRLTAGELRPVRLTEPDGDGIFHV